MVTIEELQSAIIFAKADELSYKKATEDAHDRLMLAVGRLQGYQEGLAEGKAMKPGAEAIVG